MTAPLSRFRQNSVQKFFVNFGETGTYSISGSPYSIVAITNDPNSTLSPDDRDFSIDAPYIIVRLTDISSPQHGDTWLKDGDSVTYKVIKVNQNPRTNTARLYLTET
jgi:hypothetical protein